MTNERAKQISAGDYVMTPHSSTAYEALRVTDVQQVGDVVMLRISRIAGVTAMAGGWAHATSFIPAPRGFKWNGMLGRYEKRTGGKDGTATEVVTREECRALWRADRAALEAVEAAP